MYLFRQIIPSFKTIQILSGIDLFRDFCKKYHVGKDPDTFFFGYKFSITSCLNSFLEGLSNDSALGFQNDLFLNKAMAELIPLSKLSNTCDKIIILKNINPYYRNISKANNFFGLEPAVSEFIDLFLPIIKNIIENNVSFSIKKDLSPYDPAKLQLIDFAHTYLVNINNNGPAANGFHPLNPVWNKPERLEFVFEGYKLAIQFLWYNLLGEAKFNTSSLVNIHHAETWRGYKFIKNNIKDEPPSIEGIFERREFNIEEQVSFDSYFYRITDEITSKISRQIGFDLYNTDTYYVFTTDNYDKQKLFGKLLDATKLTDPFESLSWEDRIQNILYFYSFEVIDGDKSPSHQGIASFNIQVAGSVSLYNKTNSEFSKIIVAKFKHPWKDEPEKNDYSFGILIDTMSAAGHYASGWLIYENVCGDYSGFSGSELKTTEKLLEKYLKDDRIELRELTVPLQEFHLFTSQYNNPEQFSPPQVDKVLPDVVQKARAHLFELFVYYLYARRNENRYKITLNADKKNAEKDLVLENDNEVILIECKLNPQNNNIEEVIKKLEEKLKPYKQEAKSIQLWFWYELSDQNREIIDKAGIKAIVVSENSTEAILKNIDLAQLKHIMKDKF